MNHFQPAQRRINSTSWPARHILMIAIIVLAATGTTAQTAVQRLDSLFTSIREDQGLNGSVLVAEPGAVLYQKSFGLAHAADNIANATDTRFQLASIGKTFTSVAVLQLYERGKLRLDEAIVKYLPAFPFPKITIRHLLSHTSGLPDLHIFESVVSQDPAHVITNADVIPALTKEGKLLFEPGDRWSYSNAGYCILALVIEKITRQPFFNYIEQHVWQPAGMRNTYPYALPTAKTDPLRADNYQHPFFSFQLQLVDTIKQYHRLLVTYGGLQGLGFVASTPHDLRQFDRSLYNGKLLKAATLQQAYTPVLLNNGKVAEPDPGKVAFGLGWFIGHDRTGATLVWNAGFIPGGSTLFIRNINTRKVAVILSNIEMERIEEVGENMLRIISNQALRGGKKSLAKDYVRTLALQGPDLAAAHFIAHRADTAHFRFSPGELDHAARQFLTYGHSQHALETIKILAFAEPLAWQPYNSYAEILQQCGKKTEAIILFKKSMTLNPNNDHAKQALKQLGADN
jgi:CubicO group peptidase (beta-lactamase class C family)